MKRPSIFQIAPNGDRTYTHFVDGKKYVCKPRGKNWILCTEDDGKAIALVGTLVQALVTIDYQSRTYYP